MSAFRKIGINSANEVVKSDFFVQYSHIGAEHYSSQKLFEKTIGLAKKIALCNTNNFPASTYKLFYKQ